MHGSGILQVRGCGCFAIKLRSYWRSAYRSDCAAPISILTTKVDSKMCNTFYNIRHCLL